MIITPHFTIGHIMKTGGDSAKILCFYLFSAGLEKDFEIDSIFDPAKHEPFTGYEQGDRILTFRRLPYWIMSFMQHGHIHGGYDLWTPDQCADSTTADTLLTQMTQDMKFMPKYWIRQEMLRGDLAEVLTHYYGDKYDTRMDKILQGVPTKVPMKYEHDYHMFFTQEQLHRLYRNNPKWALCEKLAYGGLLI